MKTMLFTTEVLRTQRKPEILGKPFAIPGEA
jgi:hypothetical protein